MSLFILDTDTFSLFANNHSVVVWNVFRHLGDQLAITVITAEEQIAGWYALIRRARDPNRLAQAYDRLAFAVESLGRWPILRFSVGAITRFEALIRQRLNVGGDDLRIAAIALETGGTVVTRNLRDFHRVAGLPCEDWSV